MATTRPSTSRARDRHVSTDPADVVVRPVRSRRDLDRFVKLVFDLYRGEPRWTPPLILERKRFLDRKRNPFFRHADGEYFLAWRGDRPVGRITAHVDHRLNEFGRLDWGLFGFFECENDPAVAAALLDTAETWLRERGCHRMLGPMDFNTNHEVGLLVEGHEHRAQILENWHHPYLQGLLTGHGLSKAVDLLKWQIVVAEHHRVLPVIYDLAERLEPEHGIRVRHMRRRDFVAEMHRFHEVYNEAWGRNWGFVPLTDEEIRHLAKDIKPFLDEDWALVAEKDGEPVGAALTLLDWGRVLDAIGNGRLLPFGWLRALRARRRIDEIRVFALGVKPAYHHTGTAAGMYADVWTRARENGIRRAETGWILETNEPMNRAMEALGGDVVKRFRVFEKPLR